MPGTESTFERAYLKPSTIAARLELHRSQVYKLIKDGTLPHIRIGRSVRVPAAALDTYLRRLKNPHNRRSRPLVICTGNRSAWRSSHDWLGLGSARGRIPLSSSTNGEPAISLTARRTPS
jgi:excisionase family DNA binding protein